MFRSKANKFHYLLVLITELFVFQPSLSCKRTILQTGITQEEIQTILTMHNRARQIVASGQVTNQPPAKNMLQMTWSNELAAKAQQWAMGCSPNVHDPGRHFGSYLVGQNVAKKWTTREPRSYQDAESNWFNDALVKWFDENRFYHFNGYGVGKTTHYTQMVWAETDTIGCGYAFYLEGNKYTKNYVCNYGPSGNVIGQAPYAKGYPNCQSYGLINSQTYPGLCEKGGVSNYHYKLDFYDYYNYG